MAGQGAKRTSRGRETPIVASSLRTARALAPSASLARTRATEARRTRRERSDVVVADSRTIGEQLVQDGAISVVMLANPLGAARVIDLRAGGGLRKRVVILREALNMQATKVFALVGRDEAGPWIALGFREEATIPSYFRRVDAVLLGCPVRHPSAPDEPRVFLVSDGRNIELPPEPSAAQDRADRAAKVALRELAELPSASLPTVTLHPMDDADARRSYVLAARAGTALTAFAPLARAATRCYFVGLGRADFAVVASLELHEAFGSAFLELLESPTTMDGVLLTMAAVDALVDNALARGATTLFAFAPSDDEGLAMAYLHAGFQRSGLLADHLHSGETFKDATVWVYRR